MLYLYYRLYSFRFVKNRAPVPPSTPLGQAGALFDPARAPSAPAPCPPAGVTAYGDNGCLYKDMKKTRQKTKYTKGLMNEGIKGMNEGVNEGSKESMKERMILLICTTY